MIIIEFLGPINRDPMKIDISNLNELKGILKDDNTVLPWLESSAIAVNDVIITNKNTILKSGDKVSLLPPVCGG